MSFINLEYPREPGNDDSVTVSLMDVRAADDIVISYDFDRDGWVVSQWNHLIEEESRLEEKAFVPGNPRNT